MSAPVRSRADTPAFEPREDERVPAGGAGRARVTPRPAATLLLLDRSRGAASGNVRVLMGRRHRSHAFMPDKWVFPGGGVDRADYRRRAMSELSACTARALGATLPARRPSLGRALGVASVRETWEEAGLALGAPQAAGAPLPDLGALDVLARAVTPPYRSRRFDAVFFTADADRLHSRDRGAGSGELDEIAWFTLAKAMELELPSITRFVLKELGARLEDPGRPALYTRFRNGAGLATPFGGPETQ